MNTQVWLYLWAQANADESILRACQGMAAFNGREANALLVASAATTPRLRISWPSLPSPSQQHSDNGSEPSPHVRARFVALSGLLLATVFAMMRLPWKWRTGSGGSLVKARRKQHGSGGARCVTVVATHQGGVRRRASKGGVRRTETSQPPTQPQPPKTCASQAAPAKAPPTKLPPPQQQLPPTAPSLPSQSPQQQPSQPPPSPSLPLSPQLLAAPPSKRRGTTPTRQSSAERRSPAGQNTSAELTVKQKVERIKEQLGLEAALPISTAVAAALESLGMPRSGTLATQIDALNSQLGLDTPSVRRGDPPSNPPGDPPQDGTRQLRAPPCKPMPPIGPSTNATPCVGAGTAGVLAAGGAVAASDGDHSVQTVVRLHVAGIMCGGCRSKVEHTLAAVPAVSHVSVNLGTGEAVCYGGAALRSKLLINAVGVLGMRGWVIEDESGRAEGGEMGLVNSTDGRAEESPILSLMRSLGDAQGNVVKRYKCGARSIHPSTHPPIQPIHLIHPYTHLHICRPCLYPGCGCEGCICAAEPIDEDDAGCDVTLGELCQRLENSLQAFGDLSKVEANPEELAMMRLPCPCDASKRTPII